MGCCQSLPRRSSSQAASPPTQQASPHASSSSPAPHSQVSQTLPQPSAHRGSSPTPPALADTSRPTAPLRAPRSWRTASGGSRQSVAPTGRPWTPTTLRRERQIFFETRVTGSPEIWAAVRLAVELLRDQGDLQGAQGVLDAAGITVPRGRIEEGGCWDELGRVYKVPRWVLSDPVDLGRTSWEGIEAEGGRSDLDTDEENAHNDVDDDDDDDDVLKPDEKGKGKAVEAPREEKVRVIGRLSDRGTDVPVDIGKTKNVKALIKKISEAAQIPKNTKLKIIYLGKVLKETETAAAQGWKPGQVLNVFVFTP